MIFLNLTYDSRKIEVSVVKIAGRVLDLQLGKIFGPSSHGCTSCANLEMESKYLMKSDIQLKPNISRTKNDQRVL